MKTCSKCKIEKPFEDFGKRKGAKDGKKSRCKECHNAQNRAYNATPEGRATKAKSNARWNKEWNASPEGRAWRAGYSTTPERRATKAKWRRSTKGREYMAEWRSENYTPSPEWEIKKYQPHVMYLIRFTQGNRTYIKVGLTGRTTEERFATDISNNRMNNLEILDVITFKDFETCNIAESIIHDATLDSHVTPVIAFGGSVTECRLPEATEQILSMFESARAAMDN